MVTTVETRQAAGWAIGAAAVGSAIGIWFWLKEAAYAGSHPNSELASTLQWVGIGMLFLGVAIGLLAWGVLRRSD